MEEKLNFEAGMQELEVLTQSLESGEMTLEASFAAFERANLLRKELKKLLDEGDERLRVLTASGEDEMNAEEIK